MFNELVGRLAGRLVGSADSPDGWLLVDWKLDQLVGKFCFFFIKVAVPTFAKWTASG